jgi:long-chain acyl-CoA synthetase
MEIHFLEDPGQIMERVKEVSPSVLIGVPRFFEKVHAAAQERLGALPTLLRWTVRGALAHRLARVRKGSRPGHRFLDELCRMVLRPLRNIFGNQLKLVVTGSAPCPLDALEFFLALDIPMREAYGVSESLIPVAMNRHDLFRVGSVGPVVPGVDLRLANDGEICIKTPSLFSGYAGIVGNVFDEDGYYRTGDLGKLDADGFLYIVGRKNDAFKTSTGKWVMPNRIEVQMTGDPRIDQTVIIGRGRKAIVALVTARAGAGRIDAEELLRDLAPRLTHLPAHERPAALILLPQPFSVEGGELTSTLKLRRKNIEAKYADRIEEAYRKMGRSEERRRAG